MASVPAQDMHAILMRRSLRPQALTYPDSLRPQSTADSTDRRNRLCKNVFERCFQGSRYHSRTYEKLVARVLGGRA
jgi:hypothetical protein